MKHLARMKQIQIALEFSSKKPEEKILLERTLLKKIKMRLREKLKG